MHQITSTEIKQVKRLARQLECTSPHLKHGQRLDIAATQVLGIRNYHEATRLYEKWIMLHVHTPEDRLAVSKCDYCRFSFAADLKEDRQEHRERHKQFHDACEALGYHPGTHVQQEIMKRDGHELATYGQTIEERIKGVLQLLRGWFDRSLANAIYGDYWCKHPTFETYVAMALDILGDRYAELRLALATRYGHIPGVIESTSNWYPKSC